MGTAGLVGPLATYATMVETAGSTSILIAKIIGLYFIAPALLSLGINIILKKLGWVKPGDMKLNN